MTEQEFVDVINDHPKKVGALYKGVPTSGLFDLTVTKLYTEDGKYISDKAFTFTYVTSTLPAIDNKKTTPINIGGTDFRILTVVPESKFITNLDLEEWPG